MGSEEKWGVGRPKVPATECAGSQPHLLFWMGHSLYSLLLVPATLQGPLRIMHLLDCQNHVNVPHEHPSLHFPKCPVIAVSSYPLSSWLFMTYLPAAKAGDPQLSEGSTRLIRERRDRKRFIPFHKACGTLLTNFNSFFCLLSWVVCGSKSTYLTLVRLCLF